MEDHNYHAFVYALSLAILADDDISVECLSLAQDLSLNLDEIQFKKAKKLIDHACKNDTLEEVKSISAQIIGDLLDQPKETQQCLNTH